MTIVSVTRVLSSHSVTGFSGSEVADLGQLSFSWYYTFGLHFCESQHALPTMASTRIFVIFLWLYTMVLTIGYSTNLTAFLLVTKAPAAIETIKDLYDSGLEVAAIGDIYRAGIASASDPHLRVRKGWDAAKTNGKDENKISLKSSCGKCLLGGHVKKIYTYHRYYKTN